MASRSPSRGRYRSRTHSPAARSERSRSPQRRHHQDSRSPARSTSPQRRNGRYRSRSRTRSRSNSRSRSRSRSWSRGALKVGTNRGTAYILYDYEDDAEAAIAHMHEAQVDGSAINVSIVLPRRKLSPAPPTARRGANIDPRVPFAGARGGAPGAGMGGNNGMGVGGGGGGRRRASPGSRYGPRSDVYRPGSRSPSRSPAGPPLSRGGGGSRYRSRSNNSFSSRSRSRSPGPRRKATGRHDDHETRRRGSVDSREGRSRSRGRGPK
ncbi:hypothetical protein LB505_007014 [Fusarium chuoi]|nr:hypothetical protein LB505_007014 [Fusarium chuoi]